MSVSRPPRRPGRILFVTPWRPDERGTGPSQRAFHSLAALRALAPTTVLELAPFAGSSPSIEERVASLCRGEPTYFGHARARLASTLRRDDLAGHDTIHLFRACSIVALDLVLDSSPGANVQVDLDDLDSLTFIRIARLRLRNGEPVNALREALSGALFARIEARVLSRADRVFVSSEVDRARIASRMPPGAIAVLPNVVTLPEKRRAAGAGPPRFLFVGNCGYYPNEDAVRTLLACGERLARAGLGAAIDIVGPGSVEVVRRFGSRSAGHHAVLAHDFVPDVAPFFAAATALLVPLRAGGAPGSRSSRRWLTARRWSRARSPWRVSTSRTAFISCAPTTSGSWPRRRWSSRTIPRSASGFRGTDAPGSPRITGPSGCARCSRSRRPRDT